MDNAISLHRRCFCPVRTRSPWTLSRARGRCYDRRFPTPAEKARQAVAQQVELTSEQVWSDISTGLRDALSEQTFQSWFGEVGATEVSDLGVVISVPNDFTREWIEEHFRGLLRAVVRDAVGDDRPVRLVVREEPAGDPANAQPPAAGRGGAEPQVHVRHVRDRIVEPLRARGRSGGRRGAREGVQPPVHLRRDRPRQDTPPPGGGGLHQPALAAALGPLRHERDPDQRLHQLDPREARRGTSSSGTATTTSCWSTTSSSSSTRSGSRRSSSTPSTRSTRPAGRSSCPRTGRRGTSRRSRSDCGLGSSGV